MPYLTLPGAQIFYEWEGQGNPPLVFVHGIACAHDDWQAQLDYFRPRQCVVACDLRGHGASTVGPAQCDIETYGADLSALLYALELPPAILVGHSMGCRVVLQAYGDAPQRVAGLVLIDGSRLGTGDLDLAEQAVRQRIQAVGYPTFVQGVFIGMFLEASDPALKERIIRRALALPEAIGAALFPRFVRWDAQSMDAALARVAVPTLVIQSTSVNPQGARIALEPGATSPWLELVRRLVPAAQIDVVSSAGHFVMVEKPQVVNQRLEEFIAELRCAA
jgi:pimeloyl-ACP methyl ester carboxylesterase